MGASITIRNATGTITSIHQVMVADTAIRFALVTSEDRWSRWAIRLAALHDDACFQVGDEVRYTVIIETAGDPARAQGLMKIKPALAAEDLQSCQVFDESLIASARS